jgi:beta-galactosidase
VVLFDVEAVDSNGDRCPTVEQRVDFSLSGPGIWRGGYNSGKINSTNHEYLDLECGINRVAVRSTLQPGTLTLAARSEGMETASVSVDARPMKILDGMTHERPAAPIQGKLVAPVAAGLDVKRSAGPAETLPAAKGAFIKSFNYSGPTPGAALQRNVRTGQKVYSDREEVFADVPALINGADYLQLPDQDRNYSALDLISLAVLKDGFVALAFDKRTKPPNWLARDYERSGESLRVGPDIYTIFQRKVKAGETLTLGGNSDGSKESNRMYLVFVRGN